MLCCANITYIYLGTVSEINTLLVHLFFLFLKSLLKIETANQQKHKNSTPKQFQSLKQNKHRKRCQNSL